MIVVPILLVSAITGKTSTLGTILIDNISGGGARRDYRVRAYRKGADITKAKAHRTGRIVGHPSEAEPVGNLVAKAMKELGYG